MDRGRLRGHRQLTRLAVPHLATPDDHHPEWPDHTTKEVLGDQTNYSDQLAALASTLQDGMPLRNRLDDSVDNAELIDCYRRTRRDGDTSSRPTSQPRFSRSPNTSAGS